MNCRVKAFGKPLVSLFYFHLYWAIVYVNYVIEFMSNVPGATFMTWLKIISPMTAVAEYKGH